MLDSRVTVYETEGGFNCLSPPPGPLSLGETGWGDGYANIHPMPQSSIVVLGGINMDLVAYASRFPEPGETVVGARFLTYPGGKGANQAVAAARLALRGAEGLGVKVKMIGRVGGDAFGREMLDSMAAAGVDVTGVAVDLEASSGIAAINIDASGQNRIVQVPGANHVCGQEEVELAGEALVRAAVLMLQLEVPLEVSLAAARQAASQGVAVVLDPGPALPLPAELYGYCSYITPNETEAEALVGFPITDPFVGPACGERAGEPRRRVCRRQDGRPGSLLRHRGSGAPHGCL